MEIKIYIASLSDANEGRDVGEWVELPMDEEELSEIVRKYSYGGERDVAIHSYEAPFEISEHANIMSLNEKAETISNFTIEENAFSAMVDKHGLEGAMEYVENEQYRIYNNCANMSGVAVDVVSEAGWLEDVPEVVKNHFDYQSYGETLESEGCYTPFKDEKGNDCYVETW